MLLNIHNRTYNEGRASSSPPASLACAAAACVAQRGRSSGRRRRGRGEHRCNRATFWRAWSYCWYLHIVSVVYGRARIFLCDALIIVAYSVYFLAQRRALVDARVELAVGDANVLFVRLKTGKMLVEERAALQNSLHVFVIVLQKDVGTKQQTSLTCALCGRLPLSTSVLMSTPTACRRSQESTSRLRSVRRPLSSYASFAC